MWSLLHVTSVDSMCIQCVLAFSIGALCSIRSNILVYTVSPLMLSQSSGVPGDAMFVLQKHAIIFDTMRGCYEAYVIYSFYM